MHPAPAVCVIVPTYNRWPHICASVDSVLAQSHPCTECLVVDDASTDGTREKLEGKYGAAVRVLRNESNRDKSFSRNRGVIETAAEFVCFLDSDDVLTERSVEIRLGVYRSDPGFNGVSFGINAREGADGAERERLIQEHRRIGALTLERYLAGGSGLHVNSFMVSRANMRARGMFHEGISNREDAHLFLRLLCYLEFRPCGAIVSRMREVDTHRARRNYRAIVRQGPRVSDTLLGDPELSRRLGPAATKVREADFRDILSAAYRGGMHSEYRRLFGQARRRGIPLTWKSCRRWLVSSLRTLLAKGE